MPETILKVRAMETRTAGSDSVACGPQPRPKAALLGLPCADCKTYFAADLEVCPICGCNERVVIGQGAVKVCRDVMRVVSQRGSARFNPQQNGCMAVLLRAGGPALPTAQELYAPSPVCREALSTLTRSALVMGIPLEKVNQ